MRHITFTITLFVVSVSLFGQTPEKKTVWAGDYFNGFQKYKDKNIDSAMYYIRLLAARNDENVRLQDLLHNSFAQSFQKMWEKVVKDSVQKIEMKKRVDISKKLLHLMITDSIQSLVVSATPIYYWVQAQTFENNTVKLKEIANRFIDKELSTSDIYNNRVGRYALLIHQIVSRNSELKSLANKLFTITQNKLKSNPIMHADADTLSGKTLAKRSWYRYLYAYCNYALASEVVKKNNPKDADKYFLTAYEFSPDRYDRTNYSSYFYDMYFLLEEEKNTFQIDYVDYLKVHSSNKDDVLNRLLTLSLTDPTFKKELKAYYTGNFSAKEPFTAFWQKNINKGLKTAPSFAIQKMNGENFVIKEKQGKWVMLDFWGTWCGPCRAEHPDLQKLYADVSKNNQNLEILTIACKDDSTKVKAYMNEKSFDFPVAMSDHKIEEIYPVDGYPSKFLITPEGNFLTIPFGIDWVAFIKSYTE